MLDITLSEEAGSVPQWKEAVVPFEVFLRVGMDVEEPPLPCNLSYQTLPNQDIRRG